MNFLKKLLGGANSAKSAADHASKPVAPKNPAEDPNMIRVFDAYGRELFITRQQWRDNVLLGTIQNNWNDPEKLSGFIIQSLHDGFFEEMVKPAQRLQELEPQAERSALLLGVVYLKTKRLKDSERVLTEFVSKHGETGIILTNIAKIHAERGDDVKMLETLWRSLQLDPNQDNGMGWYEVIHREKGGETAGIEALRRIAAVPGSWRAQLWLARSELKAKNLDGALALYRECLARLGKPAPTDALMQMSGDLGNAGHLAEIVQLVEPLFDPQLHGLQVGNNLLKAHFDLGHHGDARRILEQLYSLKRPDWKNALSYWDTELAKAGIGDGKVTDQKQVSITILVGQGPIWLKPDSPAAVLYPAKPSDSPMIAFLGCSAEKANPAQHPEVQLADPPGRMSRALPLFLSEQMEFLCGVRTQTLVPWIFEPQGGFVVSGAAWTDEDAVKFAQQCEAKCDYVVLTHLDTKAETWNVELRLVRTSDGQRVSELSGSFQLTDPTQAIKHISHRLAKLLIDVTTARRQELPRNYSVPDGQHFPLYLLRLEQLLAARCAGAEGAKPGFLNGERDIIDGNLQQCLDFPSSVNARLLLAQTLLAIKGVRPDVLPEFSQRITLLQKEKPLNQPAQGVVQRVIDEAVG